MFTFLKVSTTRAIFTLIILIFGANLFAQNIDDFTKSFEKKSGFIPFYIDHKNGKIYAEFETNGQDVLFYSSLVQGVGSNDIGLDRGKLGSEHVVRFEKHANKILMVEQNLGYRATSLDPLEKRAVEESFAKSVWFGSDIKAEQGNKYLVDLTPFLFQDIVNAAGDISRAKQGSYKFDAQKSALYLPGTKNFPQNTELEMIITLTGENAGGYLSSVTPTSTFVSTRQHFSFVQLPALGSFKMRKFDPRVGYWPLEFFDYSTPIEKPIAQKYIVRHKLEKKDPSALVSEAVEPIIYYLDPGTPEPIRSALFEGASWWNQAFESAGYKNAFQMKMLPADADPMDIRYNLIQWVHRSTRGWSYGGSITDPRTGQILKGKVTLGSLRVRQDFLIAQGLKANYTHDSANVEPLLKMSLDRLKQLAAHEVGHTLGLPHNYISSSQGRASVMDYPHPLIDINNGQIDLSNAYTLEIGEYDKLSIEWGYQHFAPGTNETEELEKIFRKIEKRGLSFLTDQDARPEGSAHPETHLWDNAPNAVEELRRMKEVRKTALRNLNISKLPSFAPKATLEELLVPVYLSCRYQIEAASKVLGGVHYSNALVKQKEALTSPVKPSEQRRAFDEILTTLEPSFLKLPTALLKEIHPRAYGFESNPKETFKRKSGLVFDPMAPAEASVNYTLRFLFHPERAARLASQIIFNSDLPTFAEVVKTIIKQTWQTKSIFMKNDYDAQLGRMVATKVLENLMKLAGNTDAPVEVQANALMGVLEIETYLLENSQLNGAGFADLTLMKIKDFKSHPADFKPNTQTPMPDGAPIDPGYEWLDQTCEWK